jgi:hypothetical protein
MTTETPTALCARSQCGAVIEDPLNKDDVLSICERREITYKAECSENLPDITKTVTFTKYLCPACSESTCRMCKRDLIVLCAWHSHLDTVSREIKIPNAHTWRWCIDCMRDYVVQCETHNETGF